MDTVGNIIDKLFTVNLKIKHNQKPERFTNLEIQKSRLQDEIDDNVSKIMTSDMSEHDIIRPQHKTY